MPDDENLKMGKLVVKIADLEYPSKTNKTEKGDKSDSEDEKESNEPQFVEVDIGDRIDIEF